MNVEGIAAIVTGGGSGMGAAAAAALAAKGARVAVLGRRLDVLKASAERTGSLAVRSDVSDPESVEAALDEAERAHGPARILVHAAGVGNLAPILTGDGAPTPHDLMKMVVTNNLLGTLYTVQAFAARLLRHSPLEEGRRGVVINVSSTGAADGIVGASYVASKGGVDAVCLSLARELGPWGIRVLTISPGAIDTEMLRNSAIPETYAIIESNCAFPKRLGRPGEFASLVLHLIDNDFLNGCVIRFDAGIRTPYTFDLGGGTELGRRTGA